MERERLLLLGVAVALSACWFGSLASAQMIHPGELKALKAIRNNLGDPLKHLRNWKKSDPCTSNWTGVICTQILDDGYLHIQELRLLNKNLTGTLAPELGVLTHVTYLDFMWNNISGSIPKEIGNMTSLQLLLLSGNNISGPLPDELGSLPNITKFQLDLNQISGPLPSSFANLLTVQHFHMNNNSISGQIPPELSKLPKLKHFLLDNNNLSGHLPPQLHMMRSLTILQLDNNKFEGTEIPPTYSNMSRLVKLSLRNCNLTGAIPDFSTIQSLLYLDLSLNYLSGSIPTNKLSSSITTIDLSHNQLTGTIPSNFSGFTQLQKLSLRDNFLSGDVPTNIWQNITFKATSTLNLEFQNNALTNVVGSLNPPPNVTIRLQGNPVCRRENELGIVTYCAPEDGSADAPANYTFLNSSNCPSQHCPGYFEHVPDAPDPCYCAAPLGVGVRLRSPSIYDFRPYADEFRSYVTSNLGLEPYQLVIDSFIWQKGPRLLMFLKLYPEIGNYSGEFSASEVQRLVSDFATFTIIGNDTFGPYDLRNFTLGYYQPDVNLPMSSGMSKGVLAAIVLGSISSAGVTGLAIAFLFYRRHPRNRNQGSRTKSASKLSMKVEGIKEFSFADLEKATSSFDITAQIGQGGYGKVYKGVLGDSTVVAIKRAQQGSLQGQQEFFTEIEFLSRLHHRNLVALVGYCDEESEQMLVYEFMPNGSLQNVLSDRYRSPLSFAVRLSIALGSAKGILYLHTEADPPIIHRDIKANNILIDSRFNAKVADFGISRLAPLPNTDGYVTAHISTNVKGTPGYVDPEYFLTHKLTEKSDVYSLGIVFLELLTGMQPISHGRNIVREVLQACQSGSMFSIIDRSMGPYPSECIKKFMALALKCCEDQTKARPTMLEVVRELENISSMLPETDTIASESEPSISGTGGSASQPLYARRSPYTSTDLIGSDLVSGVIPKISPR
ncbi:probable LRR receptor-like serine/threonine-protein kinase At1g06840 [Rhodamnia argentea]|uniref:non-specific serine/threonine protein kinase n=1 Tax=Rhodamnia argentea TaxID=178133 RepID=A0ABM3HZF8_9MYRT|nr:probable LRR receptor-like serine/threonine-protein kinase At1g06840 [Rhodamnia argentea]